MPVSDVDGADDSGELVVVGVGVVVAVGEVVPVGSGEVDVSVSGIGVRLQRDSGSSGPGR